MATLRCEDIMTRNPRYLLANNTLLDCIKLMKELNVGFMPVCDANDARLQGVITDRDIAMALSNDERPSDMKVGQIMSRDAVAVRPNDEIMSAARLMEEHQIRRVPVTDEDNMLVGIIATADIARHAPRRKEVESELPNIFQSISRP